MLTIAISLPIAASGVYAIEELLVKALVQLIVIIAAARIFAAVFRRLNQPAVVGEIAAGLALGPSCFGHFFPQASRDLRSGLAETFAVLGELGLVLLLFVVRISFLLRWAT